MMLFDPRLFYVIWLAIACMAIGVGLATVASLVVSILTAIQALRGKSERRPLIVEAYLRRVHQPEQTAEDMLEATVAGWNSEI